MEILFLLIAVCPAVIAALISCRKGDSLKGFMIKTAVWFYGITGFNLMVLYLRGWGGFEFTYLSVQFLFKYMVCSTAAVLSVQFLIKMRADGYGRRAAAAADRLAKRALRWIRRKNETACYERSMGIIVSFALAFLWCMFAPLDLYLNNQDEFWFDLYTLLPYMFALFLLTALAGSVFAAALFRVSRHLYQFVWILALIFLVCSYIQGNYLTKHLPPLDGTQVNWAEYASGRTESVVLWSAAVLAVVFLYFKMPGKRFHRTAKYISAGLTAMLLLTLCIEIVVTDGYQKKMDAVVTTKNQFEMSKDQNFIIFLLDAVDTGTFTKMLKDHPQYQEIFADFTYYPDTMGAYPFTSRSVPFILSGEWYENKEPFETYNQRVYQSAGLFADLEREGYRLGVYESAMPLTDRSILRFDNVCEHPVKIRSFWEFAALELKLAAFKYAPFDFKQYNMADLSAFDRLREELDMQEQPVQFDNRAFYEDLHMQDVTYTDQKCFKFLHLEGAHVPFRYDRNVHVIEDGTYEQNIEASITITETYLNKLKEAGVYDNSVILVMSDHGFNDGEVNGRQDPILLVKGMDEKHDFKISRTPVSYAQLQSAFQQLEKGENGDVIFEKEAGRQHERRFLWYEYAKDDHMVEYVQTGEASDWDTMKPTGKEFFR